MKKKTRFTKTLALALTLGLLCSGLAGCGQARNSGSTAESLATESTQTESTVADVTAESTAASAEETSQNTDGTVVCVASLKGPPSVGLVCLMDTAHEGETAHT